MSVLDLTSSTRNNFNNNEFATLLDILKLIFHKIIKYEGSFFSFNKEKVNPAFY